MMVLEDDELIVSVAKLAEKDSIDESAQIEEETQTGIEDSGNHE
jgi:DNA gyrase subunit A